MSSEASAKEGVPPKPWRRGTVEDRLLIHSRQRPATFLEAPDARSRLRTLRVRLLGAPLTAERLRGQEIAGFVIGVADHAVVG